MLNIVLTKVLKPWRFCPKIETKYKLHCSTKVIAWDYSSLLIIITDIYIDKNYE